VNLVHVAEVRNLTVQYGTFTAVQNLSLDIEEGATGLLGPNGAGKTTLLKTLLGFIQPVTGSASVGGHNVATESRLVRQAIGYMPEQDCHIPGMSAVAFVAYAGELAGMPPDQALRRAHEVLEYSGLGEARYRNVETFSTGMKQRIKLAQALIHGPKLLLLDEPTNGLDPRGRDEMLELIHNVSKAKGVNVLLCSHLLPDIERVCDRVIVMFRGEVRASGTIKDLKKIEGQPIDIELREDSPAYVKCLADNGITVLTTWSNFVRVAGHDRVEAMGPRLIGLAAQSGAQVRGIAYAQRSLEEAFLQAVNVS
jgi:ABC-2 type transport system ATP-binding protein